MKLALVGINFGCFGAICDSRLYLHCVEGVLYIRFYIVVGGCAPSSTGFAFIAAMQVD